MKWVYDLTGAEMIIKDLPIYDATTLVQGELLMLGTGNFTGGADAGIAYVSCGSASATAVVVANGVGALLETKTTADTPSIAAAHNTAGGSVCYGKVPVNPFAVYRAAVNAGSTASNGALPIASGSTAQIAVTGSFSTTAAGIGQWVVFTATAGPNYGVIRRVALAGGSAGTANLDVGLITAPTTADKVVLVSQPGGKPNVLTTDGTGIGQTVVNASQTTGLIVVDNWLDRGTGGVERLTSLVHANGTAAAGRVNGQAARVPITVYQDVMIKDHVFGVDL